MLYLGLLLPLLIIVVIGAILAFEIIMFLDVLKNKQLTDNEKLIWAIGMLLLHPIIAIVYYFVARSSIEKKY